MRECWLLNFLAFCQLVNFLTQEHMGLEVWKRYFYSFHSISANFTINIVVIGERRQLHFLVICQILESLWQFEIYTLALVGNPQMRNISRTASCRAKRMKIECIHVGHFSSQTGLRSGCGHSVFFAKFLMVMFQLSYLLLSRSRPSRSIGLFFLSFFFFSFLFSVPYTRILPLQFLSDFNQTLMW